MVCFSNHAARLAAIEAGKTRFVGPDCDQAHGGERNVASGQCVECNRARARERGRRIAASEEVRAQRIAAAERRERDRADRKRVGDLFRRRAKAERRPKLSEEPARLAALAQGAKRWAGPPCKACGGVARYTRSPCQCVPCFIASTAKPRKKDDPAWHAALAAKKAATAVAKKERDTARRATPEYKARKREIDRRARLRQLPEQRERKRAADRARELSPAQKRAYRSARRARERNAPGAHSAEDIVALDQAQGGKCAYCSAPWDHVDHKTPLVRGGSNDPENLQLLCAFHNISKSARTDEEYRATLLDRSREELPLAA